MKFTIIRDLLSKFESKMSMLAKKFSKYGCGSYTYNKGISYICEDKNSPRYGMWLIDIDVSAEYKLGDYKFVASLEWIDDAGENLIKKASEDVFVPNEYKTRRECDHCKTNRKRKSTILLYSEKEDKYIQVGKSCVKDYIGIDIGNYASYLSFFNSLDDYLSECEKDVTSYRREYEIDEILTLTLEDVRRYGYISKQKAIDNDIDSTAYKIFMMITDGKDYYTGDRPYVKYSNIETAKDQIEDVKKFYQALESNNDYINNIKTILQSKWVNSNNIALVVSAVGTKIRIEKENCEKKESNSQYIGEIGDKITFKSKVECLYSAISSYGVFRIYRMYYQNNNEIIWKTTKYLDTENVEYEFVATIKGHEEYKGVKQTEITRARIKAIEKIDS